MLRKTLLRLLTKSGYAAVDLVMITAVYFGLYLYRITEEFELSFSLHNLIDLHFWQGLQYFPTYLQFYAVVAVVGIFFLQRYGLYGFGIRESMPDEFWKITKSMLYSVLAVAALSYLFKVSLFSRFVFITFVAVTTGSIMLWRATKRVLLLKLIRKGLFRRKLIIVGAGQVGQRVAQELLGRPELGYEVVGFTDDSEEKKGAVLFGLPVLGFNDCLPELIQRQKVDEILITIPSQRELIQRIITQCRRQDVQIRIVPEMFNLMTTSVEVGQLGPVPYMEIIKTPMQGVPLVFKRAFDVVATITGLLLLSPVLLVTALAVKYDSPGPVIFKQKRIGKNGELFDFYKFRSMVVNAEELRAELAAANEADGPVFKLREDPRVTRVGRFIRKFSLDELPQLFNVLKGDMSLVGPRPPLPNEVEQYGEIEWRRLEVIPGITGLWQVSGRSNISFNKWMELDIYYIENWSFWLDLKILLQTIPVVLTGKGAY